jgi:protein SCO1/2
MPAMTMPFRVKDAWVMSALKPGYSVTADLVVAGPKSWIENVVVTTASGPPGQPSRIEGASEPTPGEPAPPFSLVNQDGKPVTLESLRGKAVALTFIYTRCPLPDYCPLMSDNFAAVDLALRGNAAVYERSRLLSITIDPVYDTPAVMKAYSKTYAPDARALTHWDFVTGVPGEVRRVALSYGLVYETENDQIVHSLRTAVIAPDGKLVKVFRGNDWKPEDVAAAIEAAAGA